MWKIAWIAFIGAVALLAPPSAAKQTIDLLNILKAKTEGNLQEDEKQLMEGLLFELRMRFVKEMSAK